MRVLQINATCEHGSTGLVVKDIGTALESAGDEVFYAYQTAHNPIKNGYKVGNPLDWKLHALFSRLFGKQAYFSSISTKKLLKWVDKIKPDIVHLHNLHSNYINLNMVLKYLAKAKIPTVITLHDCWFFTGKCYHYIDIGCEGFKTGCKKCPNKKGAPVSWIFDAAKSVYRDRVKYLSDIKNLQIVGCSDWVVEEAKKGLLHSYNMMTIRNGVSTEIFYPRSKTELKKKYSITKEFVVFAIAQKTLVSLNKTLVERIVNSLDDNSVLVIVGCTEAQKKQLKSYGDKIIAKGFIEHRHEMAEYYCLADVFINPSHADTLPTVSMESICCGTPVITYNNSGCPELVLDGCGIIVDDCDEESFINAIKEIKGSKFDCASIGKQSFDRDVLVKEYMQLYKRML